MMDLIASTVFWLVLRSFLGPLGSRLGAIPPGAEPAVHWRFSSFTLSLFNAVYCVWMGTMHVVELWPASVEEQMAVIKGGQWEQQGERCIFTAIVFEGYLCCDLLHTLWRYPALGGYDILLHHLAFLVTARMGSDNKMMLFAFGWTLLGELSTIFLDFRGYRRIGLLSLSKVQNKLLDVLFALSFFVTRVVIFAGTLVHLWYANTHVKPEIQTSVNIVSILLFVAFCLNLFWFRKICAIASGVIIEAPLGRKGQSNNHHAVLSAADYKKQQQESNEHPNNHTSTTTAKAPPAASTPPTTRKTASSKAE